MLARTESGEPYDTALWHALAADLGCAGLLVPESLGGAGASYREAAVVAEETGRSVAPVPYLGSAVVATAALLAAVGPEPAGEEDRKLLAALADGTVTAALAVPFETAPGAGLPGSVRVIGPAPGDPAARPGPADRHRGQAGRRAARRRAAGAGRRRALRAVRGGRPRRRRDPDAGGLAGQHQAAVRPHPGRGARPAASPPGTPPPPRCARRCPPGAAMLAAEQLGLAERCLEMTVGYAKERRQFARQIGSFQAIKHRLADLYVLVTQARAASRYAAACLADGSPDAPVAVAMAKAYCGDAAVKAAEECVQLHGGIGFTWEHPAHLYLKRAKSGSIAFGTPDRHRAALAGLVNLPGDHGVKSVAGAGAVVTGGGQRHRRGAGRQARRRGRPRRGERHRRRRPPRRWRPPAARSAVAGDAASRGRGGLAGRRGHAKPGRDRPVLRQRRGGRPGGAERGRSGLGAVLAGERDGARPGRAAAAAALAGAGQRSPDLHRVGGRAAHPARVRALLGHQARRAQLRRVAGGHLRPPRHHRAGALPAGRAHPDAGRRPATVGQMLLGDAAITPGGRGRRGGQGIADGRFLILPHPEVARMYAGRAADPDRWLGAMNKIQQRLEGLA